MKISIRNVKYPYTNPYTEYKLLYTSVNFANHKQNGCSSSSGNEVQVSITRKIAASMVLEVVESVASKVARS